MELTHLYACNSTEYGLNSHDLFALNQIELKKTVSIRALSKLERECQSKSSLEFYNDFYIQNGPQLYLSDVSFKRTRLKCLSRINALPLNGTLQRMHIRTNAFCQLCNENSSEGLDHFLLPCSFYDNERETLLLYMRVSLVKTSVHVLGDFNFKDIDWPDRLSKSGLTLSQSEGQILTDIMNDHGLEQMVHFPTREKNTLDLILTSLPGQFQDVHSPDKLSDHDIVSGTLKKFILPIKKPRRKVYLYQKGDYESMRNDTLEFAKEKYFNGHSDTRSVQENFDLLTSQVLFKTPRINISHRKLAGWSLQFPGLHLR